jgi:hypothetical protein
MAWLGGTTVVREGNLVRLRSEVPPKVVEALQRIDAKALLEGRDVVPVAPAPLPADAGSDAR